MAERSESGRRGKAGEDDEMRGQEEVMTGKLGEGKHEEKDTGKQNENFRFVYDLLHVLSFLFLHYAFPEVHVTVNWMAIDYHFFFVSNEFI